MRIGDRTAGRLGIYLAGILGICQVQYIGDMAGRLGIWQVYWGSRSYRYIGGLAGTVYWGSGRCSKLGIWSVKFIRDLAVR